MTTFWLTLLAFICGYYLGRFIVPKEFIKVREVKADFPVADFILESLKAYNNALEKSKTEERKIIDVKEVK